METCGTSVTTCADPVQFPLYTRQIVKRDMRATQQCPLCTKDEYMSTTTDDWIMVSGGHDKCDSDPASDPGSSIRHLIRVRV